MANCEWQEQPKDKWRLVDNDTKQVLARIDTVGYYSMLEYRLTLQGSRDEDHHYHYATLDAAKGAAVRRVDKRRRWGWDTTENKSGKRLRLVDNTDGRIFARVSEKIYEGEPVEFRVSFGCGRNSADSDYTTLEAAKRAAEEAFFEQERE